jgi:uncharacterized protein YlzI (FlbEa/FlbD family)
LKTYHIFAVFIGNIGIVWLLPRPFGARFFPMIWLTKLDNKPILLNLDNVKYIEAIPDTLILLVSGESVLVKESPAEIRDRTLAYRAEILTKTHGTATTHSCF